MKSVSRFANGILGIVRICPFSRLLIVQNDVNTFLLQSCNYFPCWHKSLIVVYLTFLSEICQTKKLTFLWDEIKLIIEMVMGGQGGGMDKGHCLNRGLHRLHGFEAVCYLLVIGGRLWVCVQNCMNWTLLVYVSGKVKKGLTLCKKKC